MNVEQLNKRLTTKKLAREQKEHNLLASQIFKFISRHNAFGFAHRCNKMHSVILGDDGKFWVCTPAIAERLCRQGYEYAD